MEEERYIKVLSALAGKDGNKTLRLTLQDARDPDTYMLCIQTGDCNPVDGNASTILNICCARHTLHHILNFFDLAIHKIEKQDNNNES